MVSAPLPPKTGLVRLGPRLDARYARLLILLFKRSPHRNLTLFLPVFFGKNGIGLACLSIALIDFQ